MPETSTGERLVEVPPDPRFRPFSGWLSATLGTVEADLRPGTIPVHISTADATGHAFDWPADRLDEVVPLIARWGVADEDATDLYAQLRITDHGHVVFEVVVGDGQ